MNPVDREARAGSEMPEVTHKIEINTPDPGYEPFPVSIMDRSTHEVTAFDPSAGRPATISYSLNKAGCIRVRLVHRRFPELVIRTLQDWTDQTFGRYRLQWDGKDASGNMVDPQMMFVLFEAKDRDRGRRHQSHDKTLCREPAILLKLQPDPHAAVKGELKIHAGLPPDPGPANEDGFEVRYYIDYQLFRTERYPAGCRECMFTLNPDALSNGPHLITVNVDDYRDHVGSAGVLIDVEN